MHRGIVLTIDPDTSEVQVACPNNGHVVTIGGGMAVCQRCGAHADIEDLNDKLRKCGESLDRLTRSIRGLMGELPGQRGIESTN
jgi:hypothetical protein